MKSVAAALALQGGRREAVLAVATLLVLAAGTGLSALALRRPRLDLAATAVASAGAAGWLLSNGPLEGPTLVMVLPGNGITTGDLLAVPAVVLIALMLRSHRRDGAGTGRA